jgi:Fic family protein
MGDIRTLVSALVDWHDELLEAGVPALIRAPLVHLYFELIHPFWDGNGRVGRVIEAYLLQSAGYRYAPFALARFYFDHIDRYFTLFNLCRKQANKGEPHPNTPFVLFHLEGMLEVINSLHDRVNRLVNVLLFEAELRNRFEHKKVNARQYAIVTQVLNAGGPVALKELQTMPWYQALYIKRTDKTKQRDLRGLREHGLLKQDPKGR